MPMNRKTLVILPVMIIVSILFLSLFFSLPDDIFPIEDTTDNSIINNNDTSNNETGQEEALLLIGENDQQAYSLDELVSFDNTTGSGGYRKTTREIEGPFTYNGVDILLLLENAGGMTQAQTLRVLSRDGYEVSYTYPQVNGEVLTYDDSGHPIGVGNTLMMIAYHEVGADTLYGGPLRIVFVGEEPGSQPITSADLWVSDIIQIEIV